MTGFHELATNDYRGQHMDLLCKALLMDKTIEFPSPFNKKLHSKCATSIRFFKRYLENKITEQKLESKVESLLNNSQQRRLTNVEDDELNEVGKMSLRS